MDPAIDQLAAMDWDKNEWTTFSIVHVMPSGPYPVTVNECLLSSSLYGLFILLYAK